MEKHHPSGSAELAAFDDSATAVSTAGTGGRADDNESFSLNGNNVVYQRRRVNPESLALRLGPELVRDLDALITPGNTDMPSFAVRKELQERYNIDRRHIYDYFHSRGLRVVKEDKHGNPVASKDAPTPLPNLRSTRQAPTKSCRPHSSYPVPAERKIFKPRGITKARPGRPKKIAPTNPKVVPSGVICETRESNEPTETVIAPEETPSGPAPASGYAAVNPLLPLFPRVSTGDGEDDYAFNSVANPLDGSFSVKRAIGDISYAYRHKLVFERMQELADYPAKPILNHTEDRLFSWNETSPYSASGKGLLVPHAMPLTRDERRAIYETLSSSLGPAHGIQECQGTYRMYMETRTKLYFEGLLSTGYHDSQQSGRHDNVPERKPNEFRHWLSETRFLKRDGAMDGSPRVQGSHRNAVNVVRQDGIDEGADKQFKQRSVAHWLPTLDELFPAPEDSLTDGSDPIADSPVLRTQQVTGARELSSQYRTGDGLPFSAMGATSPGLPMVAVTSASVCPGADHPPIHGHSVFPGPLQPHSTGTATEVPHLEPHWPEHVPSIAHTLQHPHIHRRGRHISNNVRSLLPSGTSSPRKRPLRDLDRIWTRPATSRDARRRTPSAAGDI